MKRYIIFTAMLVFALTLSAQKTNQDRTRKESNTGTVVNDNKNTERKASEAVKREATNARKEVNVKNENAGVRETRTRTTPTTTQTRTSRTATEKRSNSDVTPGRARETNVTRNREVTDNKDSRKVYRPSDENNRSPRSVNKENYGVRDRGASSNRDRTVTTRNSTTTITREYVPRSEQEFAAKRRVYTTPERRVVVRPAPSTNYEQRTIEYRRTYYPYTVPARPDIVWDIHIYNTYRVLYPHYDYWYYPIGYRVHTVSAYEAERYIGEFASIYGRVYEVLHNPEFDEYYLYFGEPYPYQDFTVIISGREARTFSRRPERYFTNRHIAVTGVVSVFEGKPEMQIKRHTQVDAYL